MEKAEFDRLATMLGESPDFKILRRIQPRASIAIPLPAEVRNAVFLDVETTGLDPENDEIIQLAMVSFTYTLDGKIIQISEPFDQLRQPSKPIPREITLLTGLTDAAVFGQHIDPAKVSEFVKNADLVIAHNAAFDRKFVEKLFPIFLSKPWGCSMAEVGWRDEGFEGSKLAYLAMECGFFYERHRAVHDC